MKKAEIVIRKPQPLTQARFIACSDVRMSYSLYIMLKACTEDVLPQLLWNWDSTQFVTKASGPQRVCIVKNSGITEPISSVDENVMPSCVKWMHMGSANGECAPFVLLVAIPELEEEDFFHYEVGGLSQFNCSGQFGHLTFCKSRAGNDRFFEWFITKIAIPTITACRETNGIAVRTLLFEESHFNPNISCIFRVGKVLHLCLVMVNP